MNTRIVMLVPSRLRCPECEFTSTEEKILVKHVRKSHGKAAVRCPLCVGVHYSSSPEELCVHKKQQHLSVRLRCFLCEFSSRSLDRWAGHVTRVHSYQTASLVDLTFGSVSVEKSEFLNLNNRHGEQSLRFDNFLLRQPLPDIVDPEEIVHQSPNLTFFGSEHFNSVLNQLDFERKQSEAEGETQSPGVLSGETAQSKVKCPYCSVLFDSIREITQHCRSEHARGAPFPCTQCQRQFKGVSGLILHLRTHTGEKPFACHICSYKTSRKDSLATHMRTHNNDRPFKCQYCEYAAKTSNDLTIHSRIHSKVQPFVCKYCKYKSKNSSNLLRHMKSHLNIRPHKCPACDFTSITKPDLTSHMRIHTNEKPFECNRCLQRFRTSQYLFKHRQTCSEPVTFQH